MIRLRYLVYALDVLCPLLGLAALPFALALSVFCADGPGDQTKTAMYTCVGVFGFGPLLVTVPFAVASLVLQARGRTLAALVVACGPFVVVGVGWAWPYL